MSPQTMAQLAERIDRREQQTPGVNFARRKGERTGKDRARGAVLSMFSRKAIESGFSILTMPGVTWEFERQLLAQREGKHWTKNGKARRTFLEAIEREDAIYRASLAMIPGRQDIQFREALPSATACVRTPIVQRFHRCSLEAYARDWSHESPHQLDGAWLDFCGPLTLSRLDAIAALWKFRLRHWLIVTVMRARETAEVTALLDDAGGVPALLLRLCPDARVLHVIPYNDSVPMVQVALRRCPSESP